MNKKVRLTYVVEALHFSTLNCPSLEIMQAANSGFVEHYTVSSFTFIDKCVEGCELRRTYEHEQNLLYTVYYHQQLRKVPAEITLTSFLDLRCCS